MIFTLTLSNDAERTKEKYPTIQISLSEANLTGDDFVNISIDDQGISIDCTTNITETRALSGFLNALIKDYDRSK
jgi:hypothetical protein